MSDSIQASLPAAIPTVFARHGAAMLERRPGQAADDWPISKLSSRRRRRPRFPGGTSRANTARSSAFRSSAFRSGASPGGTAPGSAPARTGRAARGRNGRRSRPRRATGQATLVQRSARRSAGGGAGRLGRSAWPPSRSTHAGCIPTQSSGGRYRIKFRDTGGNGRAIVGAARGNSGCIGRRTRHDSRAHSSRGARDRRRRRQCHRRGVDESRIQQVFRALGDRRCQEMEVRSRGQRSGLAPSFGDFRVQPQRRGRTRRASPGNKARRYPVPSSTSN